LLIAPRWFVKTEVVPLPPERRTTVIGRSGSATPGFARTIAGSFHRVIVPRKILG
jgi:hypothetical protein